MTVAFGFMMASVVVFLAFIHHIAQSLRAATIITRISEDTRQLLEHKFPSDAEAVSPFALPEVRADGSARTARGSSSASATTPFDDWPRSARPRSASCGRSASSSLRVPPSPPCTERTRSTTPSVRGAIHLGVERSLDEDVAFGCDSWWTSPSVPCLPASTTPPPRSRSSTSSTTCSAASAPEPFAPTDAHRRRPPRRRRPRARLRRLPHPRRRRNRPLGLGRGPHPVSPA